MNNIVCDIEVKNQNTLFCFRNNFYKNTMLKFVQNLRTN